MAGLRVVFRESAVELQASMIGTAVAEQSRERELVEEAKRDRQAFARLHREHHAAIAAYIGRRVGDPHVTEDLAAEVFVTALQALPRYRCRGIPVRAWFYRIASNTVNRWVRRHRRALQRLEEDPAAWPEADSPGWEAQRARRALLSLPPRYQTVLALHYVEGLGLEDVARTVGCRLGTVKSRLFRGREALREQLMRRR
jgi:RNA polymerase sigma-70 factor (ECF subfamily)